MTLASPPPQPTPEGNVQIDDASFLRIAGLVHREAGIVLSDSKKNLVVSRLSRRLRDLQLQSFPDYVRHLESAGRRGRDGAL
ncbi:MAG: hypothetical protein R3D85_13890 [Paracoccaceae bacterium]